MIHWRSETCWKPLAPWTNVPTFVFCACPLCTHNGPRVQAPFVPVDLSQGFSCRRRLLWGLLCPPVRCRSATTPVISKARPTIVPSVRACSTGVRRAAEGQKRSCAGATALFEYAAKGVTSIIVDRGEPGYLFYKIHTDKVNK